MANNPIQWVRPARVTSVAERLERAARRIEATASALEDARNSLESQRGHALVDAAGKSMAGYGDVGVAVGMGAEECRESPYVEQALQACGKAVSEMALLRWSLEMDDEPGPDREWEADITGHIEQSIEEAQELLEMLRDSVPPPPVAGAATTSPAAEPADRTVADRKLQWAAVERATTPAPAVSSRRSQHPLALASILVTVLMWPLGVLPGIVLGHKARRRIRHNPARFRGAGLALAALFLAYGTVVAGVVALYNATKPPTFYESCQQLRQDYPQGVTGLRDYRDKAHYDGSLAAANNSLDPGSRIICKP